MIRAAQRWSDDVGSARSMASQLKNDYLEIKYEELLDSPESTIRKVCTFLAIPFIANVLHLSCPTENLGDAKGVQGIVKNNTGKYERAIDPRTLEKVQSIACETMTAAGYNCDSAV